MMQLWPHQTVALQGVRESLKKHDRVILQAPTGFGKTLCASYMMAGARARGKRAFFLVHQNELLNQTSKALWHNKLEHGMIVPNRVQTPMPIQLASVMTLKNRLSRYEAPDLILIDEAHRALAPSYLEIVESYPNAKVVGLTATPRRTDGRGLGHLFQDIVSGPSIRWLINNGYLCDYQLFGIPSKVSMDGVKKRAGDFDPKESFERSRSRDIYGDAVKHYRKYANNKLCVVMCINVEHAEEVAAYYNEHGIRAESINGKSKDRDGILERFRKREFTVLTAVQLMIEGVDIPELQAVQWLRPTDSLIVWMQGNGRGLRTHSDKEHLIILDHVNNYLRHGMPCADREWDLEDSKRKSRTQTTDEEILSIQECPECYLTFRTGLSNCPSCGADVEVRKTKTEIIEAELQRIEHEKMIQEQIKVEAKQKRQQQGRSQSITDLIELGARNNYKNPWAWATNVFFSRMNKKPTSKDFQDARRIYIEIQTRAKHTESDPIGVI